MPQKITAKSYRNAVYAIWDHPPDDMDQFHDLLAAYHQRARDELANLDPDDESYDRWHKSWNDAVFFTAAGLFAFGHFDVFTDMLDHLPMPPEDNPVFQLVTMLANLTPYPDSPDFTSDTAAIRQWLEDHRDQLRWDEEAERYL